METLEIAAFCYGNMRFRVFEVYIRPPLSDVKPLDADKNMYIENAKNSYFRQNVTNFDVAIEFSAKIREEPHFVCKEKTKSSDFAIFGESPVFGDFGCRFPLI